MPENQGSIDLPLSWVGYEEMPIAFANQFLVQFTPDQSFVLGVGQAVAPPLIGTPEEIQRQAEEIEFVPVRTLARVALTEAKMRDLIAVLQANLDNFERARTGSDPRTQ